ncbi:MAG: peptidase T4 [Hyphomicrobiales bacterium]|nr:MAG: peptidase T4 [Hyphomicrobiales bacterium]
MTAPRRNLLTDVEGLLVGNAEDETARTGTTVVLCEEPTIASVHVMGGAPGTRDTELLAPEQTVETVDALVLSGGSAFGLEAASGVMTRLAAEGRGFAVGPVSVPIVPAAILFDLMNGGDKDWGDEPPYRLLGEQALGNAAKSFTLGSAGAGFGATTATLQGGLGSASAVTASGHTVAALVAVNAVGSVTIGDGPHYWAAPFEQDGEFGGLGLPGTLPDDAAAIRTKLDARPQQNTTIAVVATDAALTKAQAKRLAIAAHDGFARAIWPAHTPLDGDLIFSLATAKKPLGDPIADTLAIGATAAAVMSRAIARGVYEATQASTVPTWRERFR